MISYLQAVVLGLLQGVTELFPVSSLGHSVLVPAWIGGSWQQLVTQTSTPAGESPYLAFIVALHLATALALVLFFREEWVRIVRGFLRTVGPSVRARRLITADADERLAWLLVLATIPVGLLGLVLEHSFRTLFAKPLAAAIFLTLNGLILFLGERLRRLAPADHEEALVVEPAADAMTPGATTTAPGRTHTGFEGDGTRRLSRLHYREGVIIGLFQTFALLAGISRSGISMVGGLTRGLSHRDAARFSFLLATPVILAAGVLKLPTLAGSSGHDILGQAVVGALVAGLAAYASVRWLTRYFETRTLTPFAIYCLIFGIASILRFA